MARGRHRGTAESDADYSNADYSNADYSNIDYSDTDYSNADYSDTDGSDRRSTGADSTGGGGAGTKILQNSLLLMASAGLTAGIGFLFWALVAHLYSSTQIGLATTLLSAVSLISFLSTFGFGSTMIRFQAHGAARHRQVSMMLALVATASLLLGTGYVLAVKLISPDLAFIRDKPVYALILIGFCVFATINLVTDSVFLAARRAEYNTLVDGIIQSLTKLVPPAFAVGMGAMGIVAASGTGYVVATLASLYFMHRKLGFRFAFRLGGTRIRETASYSATTHFSSLLNLIPQLALPIIVLRWLGPDDVTYYYLSSQIAALLSTGSYAIGDALFSEGAHDPEQLRGLMKRSAKIMTAVMVPGVAAVIVVREPLLSLFGSKYPAHAQALLAVLALGALAVAFHTWASSALRIMGRMKPLLGSNIVYLVATLALALGFAHRGLNWVGWAWALGNLASGLFAVTFVLGAKMAVPDAARRDFEPYEEPESDEDFARRGDRVPAGVGAGAPHGGPPERPRAPTRPSAWAGVGDSTGITEPMFFPWNRPEVRRRSDRFDRFDQDGIAGMDGMDDDGYASPRFYGGESWGPVRTGNLRVRPRSMPRQPGPAGPGSAAGRAGAQYRAGSPGPAVPPPATEPDIIRPINVPESFLRPEPEDPDPRPGRHRTGPESPVDDRSGADGADDRWWPSGR
jgi:O-antigen/teichoic acid export membrane protein